LSKLGVSSLVVVNTCAHSLSPGFKPLSGHYSETFFLHMTESPIIIFSKLIPIGNSFYTHHYCSSPTAPATHDPMAPKPLCCATHSPLPPLPPACTPLQHPPSPCSPVHCTCTPKPPHSGMCIHPFPPPPPSRTSCSVRSHSPTPIPPCCCAASFLSPPLHHIVLGKFGFKLIQTWFEPKPNQQFQFRFGDSCHETKLFGFGLGDQ